MYARQLHHIMQLGNIKKGCSKIGRYSHLFSGHVKLYMHNISNDDVPGNRVLTWNKAQSVCGPPIEPRRLYVHEIHLQISMRIAQKVQDR